MNELIQTVTPIRFKKVYSAKPYHRDFIEISQYVWTIKGFSGLLKPWHDDGATRQLAYQEKSMAKLIRKLDEEDIGVRAYCALSAPLSDHTAWERPALLFCQRAHWSWMTKARKHAGSKESMDTLAAFILEFMSLQVEYKGKADLSARNIIASDPANQSKKYLGSYHKALDRIKSLNGIDYRYWLRCKVEKFIEFKPEEPIQFRAIVNENGLDPDLSLLKRNESDPWRKIRAYLGLSEDCQFPDGYIPKGWTPAAEDFGKKQDIISVTGDGFYRYKDGSQWRGKRHYAANKYYIIKCDFSNFDKFSADWNNPRFLSRKPTWAEYSQWALYPNIWNEEGESLCQCKHIKWRKQ